MIFHNLFSKCITNLYHRMNYVLIVLIFVFMDKLRSKPRNCFIVLSDINKWNNLTGDVKLCLN